MNGINFTNCSEKWTFPFVLAAILAFEMTTVKAFESDKCRRRKKDKRPCVGLQNRHLRGIWSLKRPQVHPRRKVQVLFLFSVAQGDLSRLVPVRNN